MSCAPPGVQGKLLLRELRHSAGVGYSNLRAYEDAQFEVLYQSLSNKLLIYKCL